MVSADGFGQPPSWSWFDSLCLGNEVCTTGDVNGYGKRSTLAFVRDTQPNPGRGDVWWRSQLAATLATPSAWVDIFCLGNEVCTTGDVNGDGKDDILAFVRDTQPNPGQGNVWVTLSDGASFGIPSVCTLSSVSLKRNAKLVISMVMPG